MTQLLCAESFLLNHVRFREKHYNDARKGNNCHYIGFLRKGSVRIVSEHCTLSAEEGELFYIPMGLRYQSFWSGFPEIFFESFGFSFFPSSAGTRYVLQKIPLTEEILSAVESLSSHLAVDCRSVSELYRLISLMLPVMQTEDAGDKHRAVEEAISYMRANDRITVPELAHVCRISESGLYAAFRETKGCTPIEMWHRILAERAETFLVSTDFSVEEIAERLGFCSASYFRKILREVTGRTPREIRARARTI